MKTVTLAVEGMMCGHCEARVQDALTKIEGIASVKASAQNGQVTCEYDEVQIQEDTIIDAIEAVGYDVKK